MKNFTVAECAIAGGILIVVAAVVAFSMRGLINQHMPAPATTTAPIITYGHPVAGWYSIPPSAPPIKEAEKESAWTANANVNATAGVSPRPTTPTTNYAKAVSGATTATTTGKTGSLDSVARSTETAPSSATDDPYRDSMLPRGSKWETPISTVPVNASTASASASPKTRTPSATTASATNTPPSTPDWTRCSASWAQTLSLGKSGEQIWTFSTTLSDADVQDLATSVRWYADIAARHPTVARNYAWLDCAGWRVRDYHQHGSNVPPADYYGAQGLDSPLGTCHSTTPTARHYGAVCGEKDDASGCVAARAVSTKLALGGVIEDDGKIHGLVRWAGDGLFYEGTIADVACATGCSVEFNHPCSLPSPLAILFTYSGAMQTNGKSATVYTWWYGEDPRAPGPWAAGWMAEVMP